jgi:hypothetical protein
VMAPNTHHACPPYPHLIWLGVRAAQGHLIHWSGFYQNYHDVRLATISILETFTRTC